MDTFDPNWCVDVGSTPTIAFATKTSAFGNGYEQVVPDGLNSASESWSVSMFGELAKVKPVYDFLKAKQGAQSFLWTTPLGDQIQVRCTDLRMPSEGGSAWTLTATFKQSFSPN